MIYCTVRLQPEIPIFIIFRCVSSLVLHKKVTPRARTLCIKVILLTMMVGFLAADEACVPSTYGQKLVVIRGEWFDHCELPAQEVR